MARRLSDQASLPHLAAVATAAALYGGITVGGRYFADRGFSLLEVSLVGVSCGGAVVIPWMGAIRRYRPRRSELALFAAFGVVGAALQLTQFAGVVLGVPVAIVALLLYTQPVWTVVLGRVWLGEPVTRRKLSAVVLALAGTLVLVDPFTVGSYSLVGLACAALAGLLLSLWVVLVRMSALRGNHPLTTTGGYMGATVLVLLASWPALEAAIPAPQISRLDPGLWLQHAPAVAGYTLGANLLPGLLAMWGVRRVQASVAGVVLLLEPVSAALMAYAFFDEALASGVWLGGALIIVANVVLLAGEWEREDGRTGRASGARQT